MARVAIVERGAVSSVTPADEVSRPHELALPCSITASCARSRAAASSGSHPTADGRSCGDLRTGDALDGIHIVSDEIGPHGHDFAYDILAASSTGVYDAEGALIGSTLTP